MSFVRRSLLFLSLIVVAAALSSCENTPTGPGTGGSNVLEATIDGTRYTFTLENIYYDSTIHYSFVYGEVGSGAGMRTLTVTFTSDITTGSFPRTLQMDDVNIIYVDHSSGTEQTYDCRATTSTCTMTLTASDGSVVDGTFSGRLAQRGDAAKLVTVTNGEFSVEVQ
jgi:hypothetical protein